MAFQQCLRLSISTRWCRCQMRGNGMLEKRMSCVFQFIVPFLGQVLAPFLGRMVARGSISLFSRLFFINQFYSDAKVRYAKGKIKILEK